MSGGFVGIGKLRALEELEAVELKELSMKASKAFSGGFVGIGAKKTLEELEAAEEK